MIQLTFLGHQGMLIGDGTTWLAVDPIIERGFGDGRTGVELWPPRDVDVVRIPPLTAVLLTHEHGDHVHLPSLARLPRSVPVWIGPHMITAVEEAVCALGFAVHRHHFTDRLAVGSLEVTLWPPGEDTVLWESRVSQVHVLDGSEPGLGGMFVCVDALPSSRLFDMIDGGEFPRPRVVVVSNNSQVTPPGVFGSLDNLRDHSVDASARRSAPIAGLGIIHELLSYVDDYPQTWGADVVVVGGGFVKDYDEMGPFPCSDQDELAAAADALSDGRTIVGPLPGEHLELTLDGLARAEPAPWITIDRPRWTALRERRARFLSLGGSVEFEPRLPALPPADELTALDEIHAALNGLTPALLTSPLGRELVSLTERPLVVVCHRSTGPSAGFILNLLRSEFSPAVDICTDEALARYPHGVEVFVQDLCAVFAAEMEIWDIAGVSMRSWYVNDPMSSFVAFAYDYLAEQARPLAARAALARQSAIVASMVPL